MAGLYKMTSLKLDKLSKWIQIQILFGVKHDLMGDTLLLDNYRIRSYRHSWRVVRDVGDCTKRTDGYRLSGLYRREHDWTVSGHRGELSRLNSPWTPSCLSRTSLTCFDSLSTSRQRRAGLRLNHRAKRYRQYPIESTVCLGSCTAVSGQSRFPPQVQGAVWSRRAEKVSQKKKANSNELIYVNEWNHTVCKVDTCRLTFGV